MPEDREEVFTGGPDPKLEIRYNDGKEETLTGDAALATSSAPEAREWQSKQHAVTLDKTRFKRDDRFGGLGYKIGKGIHDFGYRVTPTWLGEALDQGPTAGAVTGGALGMAGGALTSWIAGKLGKEINPWVLSGVGALAGSGLGALNGHLRRNADQHATREQIAANPMAKEAAMFRDPRNFILEKLQGANDIDVSMKAQLANKIRSLDINTANRLADTVRAAIGFGVGALIAKFLFGSTWKGALLGGVVGVIGSALASQANYMMNNGYNRPQNLLTYKPPTYYY